MTDVNFGLICRDCGFPPENENWMKKLGGSCEPPSRSSPNPPPQGSQSEDMHCDGGALVWSIPQMG